MNATTTPVAQIEMAPASKDRRESYGVLLESVSRHRMTGRGIHNPSHDHEVQVWENRNGKDPHGKPTTERFSYLLSARATVISAHPGLRDVAPQGPALALGDVVELTVGGYVIATIQIAARPLHDPHGVLVA